MSASDDRPPESGDASHFDFDDLVLDEEFIRSATYTEASAAARVQRKREQQLRRSRRFPRPLLRRIRTSVRGWGARRDNDRRYRPAPEAPRIREWTPVQWVVVVIALALAGTFVWALTGWGSKAHTAASGPSAAATTQAGPDRIGSCRGILSSGDHIAPNTVSCSALHSVEITGYVTVASPPSPNSAVQRQVQTSCAQSAQTYAGGQLPATYKSGYLPITTAQWSAGDRSVECTVFEPDNAGHPTPVTGSVSPRAAAPG
jgi:hypothetical protein